MQQHDGNLLLLNTCSINLCQTGRGSDFFEKKYFVKKQLSKKILQYAFLQPKILGRNDLYMNIGMSSSADFITLNNTVHHLCKYLYLKYAMQNKLSNFYFE